jgi:hypothetical protein
MKRNWLITITFKDGGRMRGIRSHSSPDAFEIKQIVMELLKTKPSLPEVADIAVKITHFKPPNANGFPELDWAEF